MIYENIKALAKGHRVRMADLETECGVSIGYFSKHKREDKEWDIPVGVIETISDYFDVGMDDLVRSDLGRKQRIAELKAELERLENNQ